MPLTDDDFHELQDQAVSARETAETPGWVVITDRIKQQIAARQEAMIGGTVPDWETYQKYANWLECALWVLRIPEALQRDVETHRELRADGYQEPEE